MEPVPSKKNLPALEWRRILPKCLAFGLIWLAFNVDDPGSWILGGPFVFASAWLSTYLNTRSEVRVRWSAVPSFFLFFVIQSAVGAWDVASRVLQPGLPIKPGFIRHTISLPKGPARTLYINLISLLPGTLTSGSEESALVIHALDVESGIESSLKDLEHRVARLFNQPGKEKV